jgi:predicted nuclease of predicted toxin-antitoxin system
MRLLLDENLPVALAAQFGTHEVSTVSGLGWSGIRNGELLMRIAGRFDALITADSNMEHQQAMGGRPFALLVVHSVSSRFADLGRLVPQIMDALDGIAAGEVRAVWSA